MNKNTIWLVVLAVGIGLIALSFIRDRNKDSIVVASPSPDSASPSVSPSASPRISPIASPLITKKILPTGDGQTTFIGQTVPWHLLLQDAACELKGEIKFISKNTYDNQDAEFIYKGVDHPGRNIKWTVTPDDGSLSVGPNIFTRIPLPDSRVLLGIFPAGEPVSKKYELTANIQYGRLLKDGKFVSAGGDVKVFEKQCAGKTTVVFP